MQEEISLDEQLARVLEAARQAVRVDRLHLWVLAPEGDRLLYATGSGLSEKDRRSLDEWPEMHLANAGAFACAVWEKTALLVNGPNGRVPSSRALESKSVFVVPLLARGHPLGVLVADNKHCGAELTPDHLHLLPIFALHLATAVDNAGLLGELHARGQALTEALEQQAATGEILRVISSSPADLQPVLRTLAESASRLCNANDATIFRIDGEALHTVAHYGSIAVVPAAEPIPIRRDLVTGRAVLERRVFHFADVLAEPDSEFAGLRALAARLGYRAFLAVPMLREGKAIGVIGLRRVEAQRFSDQQVALLKTFADQAAIAIENTRLFKELESRNRDLTEALEQQTATGEILRVISSSPADLQPVLDAITETAARLLSARDAVSYRFEGKRLEVAAQYGSIVTIPGGDQSLPIRRDLPSGRAVIDRAIVHVPDILAESDVEFATGKELARRIGFRTVLVAPLVRKGVAIGTIAIRRAEVGPFTEKQIELLKTFADQAVIAIENTRLFKELESRNHDLTEALEQ